MIKAQIVILGAAGFGGGELLRLLAGHPAVARICAVSRSHTGQRISAAHPHLHALANLSFAAEPNWPQPEPGARLVVFSAQPNGILAAGYAGLQAELAQRDPSESVLLIDLSGDFRLVDAISYQAAYGAEHPCPEHLGGFTYGLPELSGGQLAGVTRIANPGCFATAINLALLPLGGLPGLGLLAVSGITGSSGSGVKPSQTTHHPTRAHDLRAYKVLGHQHTWEAELLLDSLGTTGYQLSFVPQSAPLVRGIFVTVQFSIPAGLSPADLTARIHACYDQAAFVRIVEGSPRVATTVGTNYAELGYACNGRNAVIMCALDNLGKGMAGQAVQNMNLALGLPETTGLTQLAVYP